MSNSKLHVKLIEHTPNPEQAITLAARLCYSPIDIDSLQEKVTPEVAKKFITKIMGLGHMSVLEHASFTFGIEGISRVTSHQLVRHRVASFSQQSQRYVPVGEDFDFVIPPSIADSDKIIDGKTASEHFLDFMRISGKYYADFAKAGILAEDARYCLPNATETKIILTMNARELLHFFELRCCDRAQWEIRAMAIEMLRLVYNIAPTIFENAGPTCVRGKCNEGDMSCGVLREKFFFL